MDGFKLTAERGTGVEMDRNGTKGHNREYECEGAKE